MTLRKIKKWIKKRPELAVLTGSNLMTAGYLGTVKSMFQGGYHTASEYIMHHQGIFAQSVAMIRMHPLILVPIVLVLLFILSMAKRVIGLLLSCLSLLFMAKLVGLF